MAKPKPGYPAVGIPSSRSSPHSALTDSSTRGQSRTITIDLWGAFYWPSATPLSLWPCSARDAANRAQLTQCGEKGREGGREGEEEGWWGERRYGIGVTGRNRIDRADHEYSNEQQRTLLAPLKELFPKRVWIGIVAKFGVLYLGKACRWRWINNMHDYIVAACF